MRTSENLHRQGTWLGASRKGLLSVVALSAVAALASEPQPGTLQFYAATYSAIETAKVAVVTVIRTGGNEGTVSADLTTSDGTALAGSDYVATNVTLVFLNGENVKSFAVTLLDDALMEPCETFHLSLSNPTGGAMLQAPDTVTLNLIDNDTPGTAWDEASLRQAVAAGGLVRFVCDLTIQLSGSISISNDVTLDGTGYAVTLTGGGGQRLFDVTTGARLGLVHLTLRGTAIGASSPGYPAPGFSGDGGAVRLSGGLLTAVDCRFTDNLAQGGGGARQFITRNIQYASGGGGGAGGAISASNATVCLTNCLFARNVAWGGYGADGLNFGFYYRAPGGSSQGGAIAINGGTLLLSQCSFVTNATPESSDFGSFPFTGGAIYAAGCRIEAWDTSFVGNSSSFGYGGACWTENTTLQASNCVWLGNSCHWSGGAIYNQSGDQTHRAAVFQQNQCSFLGGAIHHATQSLALADCYFASNAVYNPPGGFSLPTVSGQGGALNLAGGTGQVVRSTFWRNTAQNPNGAHGFGGAICNAGQLSLANCTLAENAARSLRQDWSAQRGSVGGAIASLSGTVAVRSCTIASNEVLEPNAGSFGGAGALGGGCYNAGGNFTLLNCILAGNVVNTNEPVNASGVIDDLGHNLSSDATPAFSANGSQNDINPRLGLLALYGGLTPTLPLLSGSPALDTADASQCPPTDQRGLPRPFGTGCDIGAVEQQPLHHITSIQRFDGDVRLRGTGIPNLSFTVQATTDFNLWIAAGSGMIGADGAFDVSLAATSDAQRFFRLITP